MVAPESLELRLPQPLRLAHHVLREVGRNLDADLGGVLDALLQLLELRPDAAVRFEPLVEALGLALVRLAVERLVDQLLVVLLHRHTPTSSGCPSRDVPRCVQLNRPQSFRPLPFSFAAFSRQKVSTFGARLPRSISRARYALTRTVSAGTVVIVATSSYSSPCRWRSTNASR